MKTVRHILEVKGYDIWDIDPKASVFEALRRMADKDVGALVVMQDDRLVGILSERDYARKIVLLGKTSHETCVEDIMSTTVYTIHQDQTIHEAMEMMNRRKVRHLPVVENDRLIGVISIGDVVRMVIHSQRETIRSYEPKYRVI